MFQVEEAEDLADEVDLATARLEALLYTPVQRQRIGKALTAPGIGGNRVGALAETPRDDHAREWLAILVPPGRPHSKSTLSLMVGA